MIDFGRPITECPDPIDFGIPVIRFGIGNEKWHPGGIRFGIGTTKNMSVPYPMLALHL
jgi:hypothetical protein